MALLIPDDSLLHSSLFNQKISNHNTKVIHKMQPHWTGKIMMLILALSVLKTIVQEHKCLLVTLSPFADALMSEGIEVKSNYFIQFRLTAKVTPLWWQPFQLWRHPLSHTVGNKIILRSRVRIQLEKTFSNPEYLIIKAKWASPEQARQDCSLHWLLCYMPYKRQKCLNNSCLDPHTRRQFQIKTNFIMKDNCPSTAGASC